MFCAQSLGLSTTGQAPVPGTTPTWRDAGQQQDSQGKQWGPRTRQRRVTAESGDVQAFLREFDRLRNLPLGDGLCLAPGTSLGLTGGSWPPEGARSQAYLRHSLVENHERKEAFNSPLHLADENQDGSNIPVLPASTCRDAGPAFVLATLKLAGWKRFPK